MKIQFSTKTIVPMFNWLLKSKKENVRDEKELRNILSMDDYHIEFLRYGDENLPVCNINFEEAVDFFLNFDKKDFKENVRLQYKQEYFLKFYNDLEKRISIVKMFESLDNHDLNLIVNLLKNGLPDRLTNKDFDFTILFTISIGNSMGWPYENYIHFDVANLDMIEGKDSFLHIIAHEIHHTMFGEFLPDDFTGEQLFICNFAFEGLAVHFNNNAQTLYKKPKYEGISNYCMDMKTWNFFEEQFDELFVKIKEDYKKCQSLSLEETQKVLQFYENFDFTSLKTGQTLKTLHYPTYYMGCYFWGLIDNAFGKEILFDTLKNPSKFVEVYNSAVKKIGNIKYLF